ncbi:MAG: cysteine hydrolase [Acidobacteria bacterium]|nr:cysteine hydrolase [Acidobacteriota bacterium]
MSVVFLDVDTQLDFLFPCGALYAPGAEAICGNLSRLTQYAQRNNIPVISTMDAHAERDPEFGIYAHHCIRGTFGQRKLSTTLLPRNQHIVEKQKFDCFSTPQTAELLRGLRPERVVVYGVVTDVCVKFAVDGLLERNYQVSVVSDAIHPFDHDLSESLIHKWRLAHVKFPATASLCG